MEAKVVWTEKAEVALMDIFDFACNYSEKYAKELINKILSLADSQLSAFPESGNLVLEFDYLPLNNYRQLLHKDYRIIYRFDSKINWVFILTIVSTKAEFDYEKILL